MLASAGFPEAARASLDALLKTTAGGGNRNAWLMMLELLRALDRRADYDWQAAGYRDRFRQPAPPWERADASDGDRRRNQGRQRPDFYPIRPDADGTVAAAIAQLPAFARSHGSVRVDASELTEISPADAVALAVALRTLRREGLSIWVNRPSALEQMLHGAVSQLGPGGQSEGHWGLLLEVLTIERKPEAYERAALEYSVARDRRAPPWEDYVNPILAAYQAAHEGAAAASAPAGGALSLKGVVSSDSQEDLRRLADTPETQSEIVIDVSGVLRIDFAACPMLQAVVNRLAGSGKRVIFSGLSELNAVLLEAFSFNRHAILLRRDAA